MTGFAWTDREVRSALELKADPAAAEVPYRQISTDSRTIEEGDLFLALEGERFDGHDYVDQAVARGAAGVIAARPVAAGAVPVYQVEATLTALGQLARHRRRRLPARVVGITGSVGKTTTKDLTQGALAHALRVHATRANLNNQIGVPRTLLEAPADADVLVVEMGTNEPGEIGILTGIAEPEIGVVTTVGETHLEGLGSREGVLSEKLDLLRGLPPSGDAVVGDQPPELPEAARRIRPGTRVAGWTDGADPDLRPADATTDDQGHHTFGWRGEQVTLRIPGRHTVVNALLALAVAELLEVSPAVAARGVGTVSPAAMRGEIRRIGGLTVVVDCYNASPQSVLTSIDVLESLPAPKGRVAVLGSMLELGDRSHALHDEVLAAVLARSVDLVVATGAFAAAARRMESGPAASGEPAGSERLMISDDPESAYETFADRLGSDVAVLLKASRGVRLERLLEPIERDFGTSARNGARDPGQGVA